MARGGGADTSASEARLRGVSARAVAVGLGLTAFMAVAIPYTDMIIKGSQMGVWNTNPGAIFLFFMLVATANVAMHLIHPALALDRSELAVIYIMLLVANTLPARGFVALIMPVVTGATYYASPENDWGTKVIPYLPEWATIQDAQVVQDYYEGVGQSGAAVPWAAWIQPLSYWILFGLALYLTMISISVILRKQWVERERLVFPMMQLPIHMLEGHGRSAIPPFFKQYALWLGFIIPFAINNVNALHDYFHYIPGISLHIGTVPLFRNSITMGFTLSFTVLGFSYLISRNIAAGLLFFHLINVVQQGMFRMLGIQIDVGPVGAFGHYAQAIVIYQAMGAMIVMVPIGLWHGRHHLRDVLRKAFARAPEIDDSDEMMSYRQAVLGLVAGVGVMTVWLWKAGMPLWIVPILLFSCFVLFLTISRVVAEGGVAVIYPPITGPDFTAAAVGTSALGPGGGAAVAMSYVWGTDTLLLLMTSVISGLKVADRFVRRKRRLFWAIAAAAIVTILVATWMRLETGYEHGAINLTAFYADNCAQYPYRFMAAVVATPTAPHLDGMIQTGIGALVMVVLEVLHYKFLWWPFHPLGFPVSAAFGQMWFSLLLAFVVKNLVLKYGGPVLYRRTVPFFLGLILGEIVPAGIWLIVDYRTGMVGNVLGSFMN